MGRELVRLLADQGHAVSVLGRSAPSEADSQLANVEHWAVDILQNEALKKTLGEIISARGNLNSLVFFQRFRGDSDSWEGEIETSLTATKNTIEFLADKFRLGENCSIVAVGSIASDFIADEQPVSYHVGKSGLGQMVRPRQQRHQSQFSVTGHDGERRVRRFLLAEPRTAGPVRIHHPSAPDGNGC